VVVRICCAGCGQTAPGNCGSTKGAECMHPCMNRSVVTRSPCAGAALDPPLWIVPNKALSLSLSLAKLLNRATQPVLVSPGGGDQAQWYHLASLSSESGERLRHEREKDRERERELYLKLSLSLSSSLSLSLSLSLLSLSLSLSIPHTHPYPPLT
jgi:hypothetical protein